jgi:hypothetical protein
MKIARPSGCVGSQGYLLVQPNPAHAHTDPSKANRPPLHPAAKRPESTPPASSHTHRTPHNTRTDPPEAKSAAATDKLALAQQLAAKLAGGGVTNVVLLEGLVDAATVADEGEKTEVRADEGAPAPAALVSVCRVYMHAHNHQPPPTTPIRNHQPAPTAQITEMVYEEALRCGRVKGIAVPLPPLELPRSAPCRVYVRFGSNAEAAKLRLMMDGRLFDDRRVCSVSSRVSGFIWGSLSRVWMAGRDGAAVNPPTINRPPLTDRPTATDRHRQVTADFVTEVEYNRSALGEWFTGAIPDAPLASAASGGGGLTGLPMAGSLTGLPTIKL